MLESVSERVDGETPSDSDWNELLVELRDNILNGGLPASSFLWPLRAEGNIDMQGYSLLNVASTSGVITVNASKTLASAVADVNTAGGGVIKIEEGYAAVVPASGLELLNCTDVHIVGGRDSQLVFSDQDASRVCLTLNNCSRFSISGLVCVCSGSGTNIQSLIELTGCSYGDVYGLHFVNTLESVSCIRTSNNGSNNTTWTNIRHNTFNNPAAAGITLTDATGCSVSYNLGNNIAATAYMIRTIGSGAGTWNNIIGNIGYKPTPGSVPLFFIEGSGTSAFWVVTDNIGGNTGFKVMDFVTLDRAKVSGNLMYGDVEVTACDNCDISGNSASGDFELDSTTSMDQTRFYGNRAGTFTFTALNFTTCDFEHNHCEGNLAMTVVRRYVHNHAEGNHTIPRSAPYVYGNSADGTVS